MLMNIYYGARVVSIASGSRSATYELRRQASDGGTAPLILGMPPKEEERR